MSIYIYINTLKKFDFIKKIVFNKFEAIPYIDIYIW